MTTFHLYIVFRLCWWFWLSPSAWYCLSHTKVFDSCQTKETRCWHFEHSNEVCHVAWVMLMTMGGGGGGWCSLLEDSRVTKTLSDTRGYIKNHAAHKVCTSTSLSCTLRVRWETLWIQKRFAALKKIKSFTEKWLKRGRAIRKGNRSVWSATIQDGLVTSAVDCTTPAAELLIVFRQTEPHRGSRAAILQRGVRGLWKRQAGNICVKSWAEKLF